VVAKADTETKNRALLGMAAAVRRERAGILAANAEDVAAARAAGLEPAMVDRLTLTDKSVESIAEGLEQVAALAGQSVERVVTVASQVAVQQPLEPQLIALADACGLSPAEWQTLPLLVNPPSLNFVALALLAELHGRCGYFPAHLRLRPVAGSAPRLYEVAEVLDLQGLRDAARERRG